ncbi:sensor histidine kinase [Mesobacillus foraminis]|uniref:Two-component system sensor histidine kinase YesM n=1 Tax=Mesobacillus foraminis TaxID=279826 RepID=A0A4V6NKK5_9BACI|nr:histidine kinase [Mesobacillus foraminis]TCN19710.1 two-component system sensor histidine kinase YesM [Mesobacillus foraminis]
MKKVNMKLFIYFFIFFLLLTLGLFFVQDLLGARTLKENLIQASKNQISYTDKMLHVGINEANMYGVQYTADPAVRFYQSQIKELGIYDAQMKKVAISNRLDDRLLSSNAVESIAIYWKSSDVFISTSPGRFTKDIFVNVTKRRWQTINDGLYFFSVYPYIHQPKDPKNIQYIVGVKIKTSYLTSLLEESFNESGSKAFFLVNRHSVISDQSVSKAIVEKIKKNARPDPEKVTEFNYQTGDNQYYILTKYIEPIDTFLVTYTRTNEFLNPLKQINQVFSLSIVVILVIGLILIFLFYRNFYQNVHLLRTKFYQVEQGDYSARITDKQNNEFNRLFKGFNYMVIQIQALFASLKVETELRRNAEVKQLQAQINPHFLYNSLFFIMSMAKTSPDAVIKMSKHLAEYYRYMTKKDSQEVTLASELELADHYLSIMSLCKRIDYEINLPPELREHTMMPLIIQPIVENAIQHGIEERQGAHRVSINVQALGSLALITISNDGKGLTPDEIQELVMKVGKAQPPRGKNGVGLWNVNHRLINTFGEESKLNFITNDWGGLSVSFLIDFSLTGGVKHAVANSR